MEQLEIDKAKHLAQVLNAYAEGKHIEHYNPNTTFYEDVDSLENLCLTSAYNYRIKKTPEYVPFSSSLEFQEAALKHGFWMGEISTGKTYLPVNVYQGCVYVITSNGDRYLWTYRDLVNKFLWTDDGTPIGKLV